MKYSQLPYSPTRIQQLFDFNEDDGRLYWKQGVLNHCPRSNHPTRIAGHIRKPSTALAKPPLLICLRKRHYHALHVAYVYHNGCDPEGVRFIPKDGDVTNLRAGNIQCVPVYSTTVNKCVYIQYSMRHNKYLYRVEVQVDKRKHIKVFHDVDTALAWRDAIRAKAKRNNT